MSIMRRVEKLEAAARLKETVKVIVRWPHDCEGYDLSGECADDPDVVVLRWPEEMGGDEPSAES